MAEPIRSSTSESIVVSVELPALGHKGQFKFALKPVKSRSVFDGVRELACCICRDWEDAIEPVDADGLDKTLNNLCKQAQAEVDSWRSKLKTVEEWKKKVEKAGSTMNKMREDYFKELFHLREQVYRQEKAKKDGEVFSAIYALHFDPAEYHIDDEVARLVAEKAAVISQEYESKMREMEVKFLGRCYGLNQQLITIKMLNTRKEKLFAKLQVRYNIDKQNLQSMLEQTKVNEEKLKAEIEQRLKEEEEKFLQELRREDKEGQEKKVKLQQSELAALEAKRQHTFAGGGQNDQHDSDTDGACSSVSGSSSTRLPTARTAKVADCETMTDVSMAPGTSCTFGTQTKEAGTDAQAFTQMHGKVELATRAVQSKLDSRILDRAIKLLNQEVEKNWDELVEIVRDQDELDMSSQAHAGNAKGGRAKRAPKGSAACAVEQPAGVALQSGCHADPKARGAVSRDATGKGTEEPIVGEGTDRTTDVTSAGDDGPSLSELSSDSSGTLGAVQQPPAQIGKGQRPAAPPTQRPVAEPDGLPAGLEIAAPGGAQRPKAQLAANAGAPTAAGDVPPIGVVEADPASSPTSGRRGASAQHSGPLPPSRGAKSSSGAAAGTEAAAGDPPAQQHSPPSTSDVGVQVDATALDDHVEGTTGNAKVSSRWWRSDRDTVRRALQSKLGGRIEARSSLSEQTLQLLSVWESVEAIVAGTIPGSNKTELDTEELALNSQTQQLIHWLEKCPFLAAEEAAASGGARSSKDAFAPSSTGPAFCYFNSAVQSDEEKKARQGTPAAVAPKGARRKTTQLVMPAAGSTVLTRASDDPERRSFSHFGAADCLAGDEPKVKVAPRKVSATSMANSALSRLKGLTGRKNSNAASTSPTDAAEFADQHLPEESTTQESLWALAHGEGINSPEEQSQCSSPTRKIRAERVLMIGTKGREMNGSSTTAAPEEEEEEQLRQQVEEEPLLAPGWSGIEALQSRFASRGKQRDQAARETPPPDATAEAESSQQPLARRNRKLQTIDFRVDEDKLDIKDSAGDADAQPFRRSNRRRATMGAAPPQDAQQPFERRERRLASVDFSKVVGLPEFTPRAQTAQDSKAADSPWGSDSESDASETNRQTGHSLNFGGAQSIRPQSQGSRAPATGRTGKLPEVKSASAAAPEAKPTAPAAQAPKAVPRALQLSDSVGVGLVTAAPAAAVAAEAPKRSDKRHSTTMTLSARGPDNRRISLPEAPSRAPGRKPTLSARGGQ